MHKIIGSLFSLVATIYLLSSNVIAETNSAIDLTITSQNLQGEGNQLLDKAYLITNNAKVRLDLTFGYSGIVQIILAEPSGDRSELIEEQKVISGEDLLFPEAGYWINLSDNLGTYEFIITLETEDNKYSLEKKVTILEAKNNKLNTTSSLKKILPDNGNANKTSYSLEVSAENLADAKKALLNIDKVSSALNNNTRGNGISLYKEQSTKVVLISTETGIGSGIVVNNNGQIITNWHVIEGNETVDVVFRPKGFNNVKTGEQFKADVIKVDEVKDLALLQLRGAPLSLSPIVFGDISEIEIGQEVHAIGHPYGEYWSYTRGLISQVRLDYRWEPALGEYHQANIIQTQTPINPGNSGGPLFTDNGEVIGINSFVNTKADGLNYSITVDEVKGFISSTEVFRKIPATSYLFPDTARYGADDNANGIYELYYVDRNGDDKYDAVFHDANEDGRIDSVSIDNGFNNRVDCWVQEIIEDGETIILWLFDTTNDGEPDTAGIDADLDGEIDRYVKL